MDDPTLRTLLDTYSKMYAVEEEVAEETTEEPEELSEACWSTHKQVGMKKKGDRMVPDCVPKTKAEAYDIVLDYLISEGLASDVESADKIMLVMSEDKIQEIVMEYTLSPKAARAGKDIGAPGKQFAKISSDAAERYGSEEAGKRVAGSILAKMRAKKG